MGFYRRYIYPRGMDWLMSRRRFGKMRERLLADVGGDVVEIGFGTGLNLPHYPAAVRRVVAVDDNPSMKPLARKRIERSPIPVEFHVVSAESLPMPDGRFFFLDHGLCDDAKARRWQRFLNPIEKRLGGGCHLDRDVEALVAEQGFHFLRLRKFYMKDAPRFIGYMYEGVAVKR